MRRPGSVSGGFSNDVRGARRLEGQAPHPKPSRYRAPFANSADCSLTTLSTTSP